LMLPAMRSDLELYDRTEGANLRKVLVLKPAPLVTRPCHDFARLAHGCCPPSLILLCYLATQRLIIRAPWLTAVVCVCLADDRCSWLTSWLLFLSDDGLCGGASAGLRRSQEGALHPSQLISPSRGSIVLAKRGYVCARRSHAALW
jgi:hypothetical protein